MIYVVYVNQALVALALASSSSFIPVLQVLFFALSLQEPNECQRILVTLLKLKHHKMHY